MRNDIHIKQKLVLVLIILLPFFTLEEQMYYYGIADSREVIIQNIKLIKDIMFIAIYIVSFFFYLRKGFPIIFLYFLPFYILLLFCFWAAPTIGAGIAGIRWCHVFFLCLCLYGCIDNEFMIKIGKLLRFILILQIASQVFELFYMPPLQGYNSWGLANRVPGIFVHPSAAGAFASANYLFLILYQRTISKRTFYITFFMIMASQIMAMSSTGIAIILALLFFHKFETKHNSKIIFIIFILIIPVIVSYLDLLAGRTEGSNETSGGARIELVTNLIKNMELVSTQFGLYTNTAVNMEIYGSQIADSSLISLLANVGLLGALYIIIPLVQIFLYSIGVGNKRLTLSMIWIFGVSLPIITMEVFPCNLIIAILLDYWVVKFKRSVNSSRKIAI